MGFSRKYFIALGNFVFVWGFVQIALIGAVYFGSLPLAIHGIGGTMLSLAALLMLMLALVGRLGAPIIGLSLLTLLILVPGQGFLVHAEGLPAWLRALHPVLGIGVMFLGRTLARQAGERK